FSLEYVEGGSLDRQIQGTPQPPRESAQLVHTLALAIRAAHEAGIIHRDLKPANILLQRESRGSNPGTQTRAGGANEGGEFRYSDWTPKVTDFGLAKKLDADSGQTRAGSIMGTPSYMAPEQAEGRLSHIGPWTDVYALGAILYEMITGRPPFKGQTVW